MRGGTRLIGAAGGLLLIGGVVWVMLASGDSQQPATPATTAQPSTTSTVQLVATTTVSTTAAPTTTTTTTEPVQTSTTATEPEPEPPATTTTPPSTTSVPVETTTAEATTTTLPAATVVTVAPFPPGDGSCHGEYTEGHRVKEQCVLNRLQYIFETLTAGTHQERMSVIRDGHLLAGVFANLEAWAKEFRGDKYPPFLGPWSGFENTDARGHLAVTVEGASWNGPDLLGVLVHFENLLPGAEDYGPTEGRVMAPAVWVDDQWTVSYFSFCRFLSRLGPAKQTCPEDPRLAITWKLEVRPEGSGTYTPTDLTDTEYDAIRDVPAW